MLERSITGARKRLEELIPLRRHCLSLADAARKSKPPRIDNPGKTVAPPTRNDGEQNLGPVR
jgi:hypothetical protein